MDIGALSNQGLLSLIGMFAFGVLVFGAVFVVSLVFQVNKYRKPKKESVVSSATSETTRAYSSVENTNGGSMSLLKTSGRKVEKPAMASAQPAPTSNVSSPPDAALPYRELLRVLVDSATKQVVVEVDGVQYKAISQVKDKSIGRRILESAGALLKFTGGYIATSAGMKSYPAPQVALTELPAQSQALETLPQMPEPVSVAAEKAESAYVQPESDVPSDEGLRFLAQMEAQTQAIQSPSDRSAKELSRGFLGRRSKPEPETETPMFNLAEEIDEIVQQKLLQANDSTRVKIHSGLGGQIQIEVAGKYYNSVDDVENPAIQNVLRSAIEEWNQG